MRKDRDWSQQQGFEALREGLGFGPKSRASYVAIDMGKRPPTTDEAKFLVRYFGKSPDDIPDAIPEAEPNAALVTALQAQVKALESIIEEMRLQRIQQHESTEALLRAMGAIHNGQDRIADPR